MAVKLNRSGYEFAERIIKAGECESFDADWQEEKPTPDEVGNYINSHYIQEYGLWFLGVNDQYPDSTVEHYEYPHGDLKEVQRSALVYSRDLAEKKGHKEIADAAKQLLTLVDSTKK